MKKTESMLRTLRRTLLLCLCIALLAGSALANEVVDISTDGYDCMYYECTLPDGRLIFAGDMGTVGNYADSRARLLCMNPDMTVSWDYVDPEEGGCRFWGAAVLKDGTIGTMLDNSPYQKSVGRKLKFFTQDGQPTGKEIAFSDVESVVEEAAPSCLWLLSMPEGGGMYYRFYDWDGNLLLQYEGENSLVNGADVMIEEEDGLVFAGRESGPSRCARIMKMDFQGNLLWETALPMMQQGSYDACISECLKTEDGGYLAWMSEKGLDISEDATWCYALAKFDANGRLQWKKTEPFEKRPGLWIGGLTQYNGRLVMEVAPINHDHSINAARTFLWMDEEGNELGTTELVMQKEDLQRLANRKKVRRIGTFELFATESGLWGCGSFVAENRDYMQEMDSHDDVFVKIPEL